MRVLAEFPHGGAQRSRRQLADPAEVSQRSVVPHDRETIGLQPAQRGCEIVDGVVGARFGAVAADILDGHIEAGVALFCRAEAEKQRLARGFIERTVAGIGVEREIRVDQPAVVLDDIGDRGLHILLVARNHHDQVACRHDSGRFHAQQGRHLADQAALDVDRPATIEKAVFLGELERIGAPLGVIGGHDVGVRHQEYRLAAATVAPQAHHHRGRITQGQDTDVGLRKSGGAEFLRQVCEQRWHLSLSRRGFVGNHSLEQLERTDLVRCAGRVRTLALRAADCGRQQRGQQRQAMSLHGLLTDTCFPPRRAPDGCRTPARSTGCARCWDRN